MSIKKKFILVILLIIIVPTIIGVSLVNLSIKKDIYKFEEEQSLKNLESVQAIFAQTIDNYKDTTHDSWAAWDSFYDAVINKDHNWLAEEIISSGQQSNKIIMVTDLNGKIICSSDPRDEFKNITNMKDHAILKGIENGQNSYAGFVQLSKGLAIVGVSKIIKYGDKNFEHPAGVFIFGDYVTNDVLKKANKVVDINISFFSDNKEISTAQTANQNTQMYQQYLEKLKESKNNLIETSLENGTRKLISIGKILDLNKDLVGLVKTEGYSKSSIESLFTIKVISITTVIIIILLSTLIIVWVHLNIIIPINNIKNIIDLRELNNVLPINGTDEINLLSSSINNFMGIIKQTLNHIKINSQTVAASSQQMNATTEELAGGTQNLSASAQETLSSMEEFNENMHNISRNTQDVTDQISQITKLLHELEYTVKNITENMCEVDKQASSTMNATQTGKISVQKNIEGINKINEVVGTLVTEIKGLGKSAVEIGEITNVIDDIAGQTNLLALNAAIEAARAGEHGKGFSVVAEAIRSLAEKSSEATKVISTLIKDIQEKVNYAVETAKAGATHVKLGVELSHDTGKALEIISKEIDNTVEVVKKVSIQTEHQESSIGLVIASAEKINQLAKNMTSTVQAQVSSSGEVVKAIENVSVSSNQMASGTQDIAKATESLAKEAQKLSALLEQFKLN